MIQPQNQTTSLRRKNMQVLQITLYKDGTEYIYIYELGPMFEMTLASEFMAQCVANKQKFIVTFPYQAR
jgi:hypothetical protein